LNIKPSLKGKWIVITRPTHQTANLSNRLEAEGAFVLSFPLLEINPPKNLQQVQQQLQKLADFDLAIFVSTNAVEHALKYVNAGVFNSIKVATTGKKTASLLESHGIKVDYCPEKIFNSEALLAISGMKEFCIGKKVAIIRGENGRDYLRDSLLRAGSDTDYFDVYQRNCPQYNLDTIKQHWLDQKLDIILLSSGTSVNNFFRLANNEKWIDELTLLLGSERIRNKIPKGFQGKILVAEDPNDETIYQKLATIYG